jgi:hypothetical protein
VGGPNIPPLDEGLVAQCVAAAPGAPMHVLLSDHEAEHIPGCNMVFRRSDLLAIGGFDERFRVAGDDVDICWRLQSTGRTLGFAAGAVVWHRRRATVRAYLRQQFGYGKAEAQLERKWPHRYNRMGHLAWAGTVYGGTSAGRRRRARIRYGTWGGGLFQTLDDRSPGVLASLARAPEWYLVILLLAAMTAHGALWQPLLAFAPLLVIAAGAVVAEAIRGARSAPVRVPGRGRARELAMRGLVAALCLAQPLARLAGRQRLGLVPWRRNGHRSFAPPVPRTIALWSEQWRGAADWLGELHSALLASGHAVRRGGDYDRWDLYVRVGMLGGARLRLGLEEHGQGRQLARFRVSPRPSRAGLLLASSLALLAVAAVTAGSVAAVVLGATAVLVSCGVALDCALAQGALRAGLAEATEPVARARRVWWRDRRRAVRRARPIPIGGSGRPERAPAITARRESGGRG